MPEDQTENDDLSYGDWVYCNQHLAAHRTGWCTVQSMDKIGLGSFTGSEAEQIHKAEDKCRRFGLPLYGET